MLPRNSQLGDFRKGFAAIAVALGLLIVVMIALPLVAGGQGNVTISKTASSLTVEAGTTISYTIVYEASGTVDNAIITDSIPARTQFADAGGDDPWEHNDGVITWTLPSELKNNDTGTEVLTVVVESPLISGTEIVNRAHLSSVVELISDTATVTVTGAPSLTVTKEVAPSAVQPGGVVTYTIIVTNDGNGIAEDVLVTDVLPSGFLYGGMISGPSPDDTSPDVVWELDRVTDTVMLIFTAFASARDGIYPNAVTVRYGTRFTEAGPTAMVTADGVAPSSQVDDAPPFEKGSIISVDWSASDPHPSSGLKETCLWYKLGTGGWTKSGLCQPGSDGTFDFGPPGGTNGTYYFQTIAEDNAGNIEALQAGDGDRQTIYDTVAPEPFNERIEESSPYLHADGLTLYHSDGMDTTPAVFQLKGQAEDVTSGLDEATFTQAFGYGPFSDGSPANWASGLYGIVSSDNGDGGITAAITDKAGNQTEVLFHYVEDVTPPTAMVTTVPSPTSESPIPVAWNASDDRSGVQETCLWVRFGVAEPWLKSECLPGTSGTFSFAPTKGNGTYSFETVAVDRVANTESGPEGDGEASTIYGTQPHTSTVYLPISLDKYVGAPPPPPMWYPGVGMGGLTVYNVAACPTTCSILYAATRDNGVYKSVDGGRNWAPTSLASLKVNWLVVHPNNCDVAYAATWGEGVKRTTDGGATWLPINTGLGDLYLYSLAITPDGQTVYAGTARDGVYKWAEGNASWSAVNAGLPASALVSTVVIIPDQPSTVYAGTWGQGVYRSTNGGGLWSPVNNGVQDPKKIYILALGDEEEGETGPVLYAAASERGVFRTGDGGAVWTHDWPVAWSAYTVTSKDGVAYAGTKGEDANGSGVFQRTGPGSWTAMAVQPTVPPQVPTVWGLAAAPDLCEPYSLLAGTTNGVWWYGSAP